MTITRLIALIAGILPVVIFVATYIIAAATVENIPWCNPYLDGCTTITATGIEYPGAYLLRAGIISSTAFFVLWWYCTEIWLEQVREIRLSGQAALIVWISMFASLLLAASMAVLSEKMSDSKSTRDLWQFHNITAGLFFVLTSVCQIFLTRKMYRWQSALGAGLLSLWSKVVLAAMQVLIILIAIVLLVLGRFTPEATATIEWWLATVCCLFYVTSYLDWKDFGLLKPVSQLTAESEFLAAADNDFSKEVES
ncbi:MAG: hypothetical protein ACPGYX_00570 [Oceanobacter sp.]